MSRGGAENETSRRIKPQRGFPPKLAGCSAEADDDSH